MSRAAIDDENLNFSGIFKAPLFFSATNHFRSCSHYDLGVLVEPKA